MLEKDNSNRILGKTSYYSGLAAEQSVEQYYVRSGKKLLARRWRGSEGEIDLIFDHNGVFVFVEVKKSATSSKAALRISRSQKNRIFSAATEFVAKEPAGLLSDMRFDVALVDSFGEITCLENALFDA